MKLLTFLGAGTAYLTTYRLSDDQKHQAIACGIAIARFFPDTDVRVFVTDGAFKKNYAEFEQQIQDYAGTLRKVCIADGSNENEMWAIFKKVVDNVEQGEEVIFDITHGFRSLPFLSFLAAAYLREVKKARIHRVFYGNYEARDQSVTPNITSVIDLTRFVSLLDWMKAVDRFKQTGNSADMAELLQSPSPSTDFITLSQSERDQIETRRHIVNNLRALSLALQLDRSDEVMAKSAALEETLARALQQNAIVDVSFAPLVQQVVDTYRPIALSDPIADPINALARERELIYWLLERGQYMQAVAIAREWLVTWTMIQLGERDLHNKSIRSTFERSISARMPQHRSAIPEPDLHDLSGIESIVEVADAFQKLGDLRNSMMHAWKRKSQMLATKAESNLEKYCILLRQLPLPTTLE